MIYFSIFLFALSLWVVWNSNADTIKKKIAIAILAMPSSILIAGYLVADYFTGSGVDESVIYHLFYGLGGAGFGAYLQLMMIVAIYLSISCYFLYLFFQKNIKTLKKKSFKNGWVLGMLFLFGSIISNPVLASLYQMFSDVNSQELKMPSQYVPPNSVEIVKKKNIIYLYLEGVERTYFDQDKFPGLMPNLMALEKESISFTNIQQTSGASWTIAGMVASQCGIPLTRELDGNVSNSAEFLPGALCLGDVLKANGYQLNYIGGAPVRFSGKGDFYHTHGFSRAEGKDELIKSLPADIDSSGWGLHDDILYKLASQKIEQLSGTNKPFGLFMLTLDTHPPEGYLTKNCYEFTYGDGKDQMLNSLHCADQMAAKFVRSILSNKKLQDTIVVVASDHLSMKNSTWTSLKKLERRNLLMVFNASNAAMSIDKAGSTMDVTPTVLNFLGTPVREWAFGRDLLNESKTLVEQLGGGINQFLNKQSAFIANYLWGYQTLADGILAIPEKKQLALGDKIISYPVLMRINNHAGINDVVSYPSEKQDLRDIIKSNLSAKSYFIWVDQCSRVGSLKKIISSYSPDDYCMARGYLGSRKLSLTMVDAHMEIGLEDVKKELRDFEYFPQIFLARRTAMSKISDSKNENTIGVILPSLNDAYIRVRSASGLDNGQSFISIAQRKSYFGARRLGDFFLSTSNRGITLIGLNGARRPTKIAYRDTCGISDPLSQGNLPTITSVKIAEEKFLSKYEELVVVVHDSAKCEPFDFESFFKGSQLKKWREIGYRTPYIGIISKRGNTQELSGPSETVLSLEISGSDAPRPKSNSIMNAFLSSLSLH